MKLAVALLAALALTPCIAHASPAAARASFAVHTWTALGKIGPRRIETNASDMVLALAKAKALEQCRTQLPGAHCTILFCKP